MSVNDIRPGLHGMWASVAPAWGTHAEFVDQRGAKLAQAMLDATSPRPDERVLELAAGPGGVGLAAAERLAPGGEVVISDFAEQMTAIAAQRADQLGLVNVSTVVLDLEQIDQPDESFDVVLCREGLMLASQPDAALAEIARVLRPGGRMAITVWGPRQDNPWLGVLFDAVTEQLGMPVPPAGIPGPFSLADGERLSQMITDSGLAGAKIQPVSAELEVASFDEWWSTVPALAGPIAALLAGLPEDQRLAIKANAADQLRQFEGRDGLRVPGIALLATAVRR